MNPMFLVKPMVLFSLVLFVFILFSDYKPKDDINEEGRNETKEHKISCEKLQKFVIQKWTQDSVDDDDETLNSKIFSLSPAFVECKWRIKLNGNSRHFLLNVNSFNVSLHKHLTKQQTSLQSASNSPTDEGMDSDLKMKSNLMNQIVDVDICQVPTHHLPLHPSPLHHLRNHSPSSGVEFCSFGFIEVEEMRGWSLLKECFCPQRRSFDVSIPAATKRLWLKIKLNFSDDFYPKINVHYYVQADNDGCLTILGLVYFFGLIASTLYPLIYYSIKESKREIKSQLLNVEGEKLNNLTRKLEVMEVLRNKFSHMFLDRSQFSCQLHSISDGPSQQNQPKIISDLTEKCDMLPNECFQSNFGSDRKHKLRELSEEKNFNGLGQNNQSFQSTTDLTRERKIEASSSSAAAPRRTSQKPKKRKRISRWRFLPRSEVHETSYEEDSFDSRRTNYKYFQPGVKNTEDTGVNCSIGKPSAVSFAEDDDDDDDDDDADGGDHDDDQHLVKLCKATPGSSRKDLFSQISDELKSRFTDSMFIVSNLNSKTFSISTPIQQQKSYLVNRPNEAEKYFLEISRTPAELYSLQPTSSSNSSENYTTFNPSETLEFLRAQEKLSRKNLPSANRDATSSNDVQEKILFTTTTSKRIDEENVKHSKIMEITFLPTHHSTPKQFLAINPFKKIDGTSEKLNFGDQILLPKLEKDAVFRKFVDAGNSEQDTNGTDFSKKCAIEFGESKV